VLLTEAESKQVLDAYGHSRTGNASSHRQDAAVSLATNRLSGRLKLNSETITHKSDVGGVRLNLSNEAAVRPLILQSSVSRPGVPGSHGAAHGAFPRV
jgi:acetyltransferase